MPDIALRTGGQILVEQLKIQGCDRIFTVPGESFLAVLDALHDAPEIETIVCRQEGGVAYMADADGKSAISYADYAEAFVAELEQARHPRQIITAAY